MNRGVPPTARKARTATAVDRWWLRGSLGALCLLTLVVVASALHRMDLYKDAYGFTRLRLVVDLFEGWLGLVVVAVIAAGIGLRGRWLPRFALLSGATLLLGLAVANPDAWIAEHNIDGAEAKANRNAIEIDDAHVRRQRDADALAHPRHALVAPARILVIFEVERLDPLADADGCRRRSPARRREPWPAASHRAAAAAASGGSRPAIR